MIRFLPRGQNPRRQRRHSHVNKLKGDNNNNYYYWYLPNQWIAIFVHFLISWNNLGCSLFCEWREKWRVVSRKFQKKLWLLMKWHFFYPSDLVNTKTTNPLRVSEEWWIYSLTLCVSVYSISSTIHIPFGG